MIKKLISAVAVVAILVSLASCSMLRDADGGTGGTEAGALTESSSADSTQSSGKVIPRRAPDAPLTVCIDAGHGYDDPGCTSSFLGDVWEREITAEYAASLKSALEERGCRVVMLHTPDKYITTEDIIKAADGIGLDYSPEKLVDDGRFAAYNRTVWANVLHRETFIDVFLSIHVNSYPEDASVKGTRIYYCKENTYSLASAALCEKLTLSLGKSLPEQNTKYYAKSYKEAFVVTKYSQMPSALIEVGFATNKTDAANILDAEWQESFVSAVAEGVTAYGIR